jgi:hypothetical protein
MEATTALPASAAETASDSSQAQEATPAPHLSRKLSAESISSTGAENEDWDLINAIAASREEIAGTAGSANINWENTKIFCDRCGLEATTMKETIMWQALKAAWSDPEAEGFRMAFRKRKTELLSIQSATSGAGG